MFIPSLLRTEDGSDTLYIRELDETYHSRHGAVAESELVFLENGYLSGAGTPVHVLEVGFGTGLNCVLTALRAAQMTRLTRYFTLEKVPLSPEIIEQLNYPGLLGEMAATWFRKIHRAPWGHPTSIHPWFTLLKIHEDFTTYHLEDLPLCQVVYFDAFAPDKQPEMWNTQLFMKLFVQMAPGGVIVTYSAKGAVRRALAEAGFQVERLPGPKGKREMLRGFKK